MHTICTHLKKIEENKKYYLKRKYYLRTWKSRGMDMKRNRIQISEDKYLRLIIWRSLVQAQAGPQKNGCNTSCYNLFLYPASGTESITSSNFCLLSENLFHAQSI